MLDITTVGAFAGPAFQATFEKLISDRLSKTFSFGNNEKIRTDLEPHLEATFNKCIKIKTLINPATQSDFLSIYSTQRFILKNNKVDQYDLVEYLKDGSKHVIITGSGGAGKSMFMRYLWLSYFVDSNGKIPIFVELRNLNKVTQADIAPYLFHTLTRGKSRLSLESFRDGLEKGEFYIILDGYDELSESIRDRLQQAIIELTEDYPTTSVVVSSRPDHKFASWQNFEVIEVAPLNKEDTIELIEKVDFDDTIKLRFIEKVNIGTFYNSNSSFLSNPLLASMMLLAFSQNYDIPDKMHQFYELAFEALYKRHDSYKPGGFKRQFHSTKDEDEFRRVFSYFCLLTFYEQKFSFQNAPLEAYIKSAIELNGSLFSVSSYIDDLFNAVCILIKEGNQTTFPHRSFQEYFAAYCLSYVTRKNFLEILIELIKRPNEQAILMIRDMNPELLRDEFVVPMAIKYKDILKNISNETNIARFMEATNTRFEVVGITTSTDPIVQFHTFVHSEGEADDIARIFRRLYGEESYAKNSRKKNDRKEYETIESMCNRIKLGDDKRIEIFGSKGKLCVNVSGREGPRKGFLILDQETQRSILDTMFENVIRNFIGARMKSAAAYANSELKAASKSTMAMKSIFGE